MINQTSRTKRNIPLRRNIKRIKIDPLDINGLKIGHSVQQWNINCPISTPPLYSIIETCLHNKPSSSPLTVLACIQAMASRNRGLETSLFLLLSFSHTHTHTCIHKVEENSEEERKVSSRSAMAEEKGLVKPWWAVLPASRHCGGLWIKFTLD